MSAFTIDTDHIDYMVTAALTFGGSGPLSWHIASNEVKVGASPIENTTECTPENRTDIGAMLLAENVRSVNSRYSAEELAPVYTNRVYPGRIDPVQTLKAIDCYEYQACEHDGWKTSNAHRFCAALRYAAIAMLPGYDAAAWHVSTRDLGAVRLVAE